MPQTKQAAAQVSEQPSMSAAVKLDLAQFEGHTPGPWRVAEAKPARFPAYPIKRGLDGIADVPMMAHGRSNHDADLIAAAPALLALAKQQRAEIEALRKALRNLVAAHDQYIRETGMKGNDLITERTEEARAALKGEA